MKVVMRSSLDSEQASSRDEVNDPKPALLEAKQAAALLNISPRTLLRWAREGLVPAHPLSGTKRRIWRFLAAELDAWALSRVNSQSRLVPEFKEK
jgi:excisionase family DNA binding protein